MCKNSDSKKGLSPEERKANILNVVMKFNEYMSDPRPPGSVLNNIELLAVAKCARKAHTCKSCDNLPDDVCTKPNFDIYKWIEKANISFDFPTSSETSEEKEKFLVNAVHAVIRHQHRLDETWYKKTQSKIQSIYLDDKSGNHVDVNDSDEATKIRCHQIFCEIFSMAITSHVIQMVYVAMGEDVPDLPSYEKVEKKTKPFPVVKDFDFMSFLHSIPRDKNTSDYSPYVMKKDINMESREFQEFTDEMKEWYPSTVGIGPRMCINFAPYDNRMMMDVIKTLYVEDAELRNMRTFDKKCTGVSRFHLEAVSAGYTGHMKCEF